MTSPVVCPRCGAEVRLDGAQRSSAAPFCSTRCRVLDLGDWADEAYRVAGRQPAPGNQPDGEVEHL